MRQSYIVEVSGHFAGAAVTHKGAFRFIAVDPRVEELHNSVWLTLSEMRRVVSHLLIVGRLPNDLTGGAPTAASLRMETIHAGASDRGSPSETLLAGPIGQ